MIILSICRVIVSYLSSVQQQNLCSSFSLLINYLGAEWDGFAFNLQF